MVNPEFMPERCVAWQERDGRVVVLREPPRVRSYAGLRAWLRWAWQPKRVRLDELGSFIWRRLDGTTSLRQLADGLRQEFPDRSDGIEDRLSEFIEALATLGMITGVRARAR